MVGLLTKLDEVGPRFKLLVADNDVMSPFIIGALAIAML